MKNFLYRLGMSFTGFIAMWLCGYGAIVMLTHVTFSAGLFWFMPLALINLILGGMALLGLCLLFGAWGDMFDHAFED